MSIETPEYAAMVRRIVRAHGRRVAEADPEDLAELVALHVVVDQAVRTAVEGLRDRHSWGQIARGLGVARQTAWQRFASDHDAGKAPSSEYDAHHGGR
jgi:hypothetical protein